MGCLFFFTKFVSGLYSYKVLIFNVNWFCNEIIYYWKKYIFSKRLSTFYSLEFESFEDGATGDKIDRKFNILRNQIIFKSGGEGDWFINVLAWIGLVVYEEKFSDDPTLHTPYSWRNCLDYFPDFLGFLSTHTLWTISRG